MERKIFIPKKEDAHSEFDAIEIVHQRISTSEKIINVESQDEGWLVTVEGSGDDLGPG